MWDQAPGNRAASEPLEWRVVEMVEKEVPLVRLVISPEGLMMVANNARKVRREDIVRAIRADREQNR